MLKFYCLILVIVAFSAPSLEECPPADDMTTLKALFILTRHTARAPYEPYPKDPYANDRKRWPRGRAMLTNVGIEQAYKMAEYYTNRYGKFITDGKKQSYLRASQVQRVIDTLSVMAKGLWPPEPDNKHWWQPMIFSLPRVADGGVNEDPHCPEAKAEEKRNVNTPEAIEFNKKNQQLYNYVANFTGVKPEMNGATTAFDVIRAEKTEGYKLPSWATPEVYNKLGEVLTKKLHLRYATPKAKKLRAGGFLSDLQSKMNKTANDKWHDNNRIKFFLYGSHDNNIAATLSAIGTPQPEYPPFGGAIMFELHEDLNTHQNRWVRTYYLNQTVSWPYSAKKIIVPACEAHADGCCPIDVFAKTFTGITPVEWAKECGIPCDYNSYKEMENYLGDTID